MIKKATYILLSLIAVGVIVFFLLGFRPFVLTSTSMEPACMKGSLVIVDTRVKEPVAGDIVANREGEIFVLHRLIAPNLLQGDNSPTAQHVELNADNVIGKEVFCTPWLGSLISIFIYRPYILFILASILILAFLRPTRKKHENKTSQNE